MIIFNGIKTRNKIPFLSFKNEEGESIDVPLDLITADRITKYLSKISKVDIEPSDPAE